MTGARFTLALSWRKQRLGEVSRVHVCETPRGDAICGTQLHSRRFEGDRDRVTCRKCLRALDEVSA